MIGWVRKTDGSVSLLIYTTQMLEELTNKKNLYNMNILKMFITFTSVLRTISIGIVIQVCKMSLSWRFYWFVMEILLVIG